MRFYCPRCWQDFANDVMVCPHCSLDIREFWQSRDYVEKLVISLQHPEQETLMRAAWLLGQLQEVRAVPALIELIKRTDDVYITRTAVRALGTIDTPEARQFLSTLAHHRAKMVRDEAQRLISGWKCRQEPEEREAEA